MNTIKRYVVAAVLGLSTAMTISARIDLEKCQSKYDKLQADVQAVFGTEQPSAQALETIKDVIKSASEKDQDRRKLEEEVLMLKYQLNCMTSDRKEIMSRLIDMQRQNRLLQIENDVFREKMN